MQISQHIQAVRIPFSIPIAPGKKLERFVYAYIVAGGSHICLVDSGVAGSAPLIIDALEDLGRKPGDVTLLLLTHAHPDHIGGARAIKKECNCQVAAHPQARRWVEDTEQQFRDRPVPGFHSLVEGPVAVDRLLSDREILDLGCLSLEVIATPGHSRCSISLFCREDGVLFTGDAIPQANDLPIYEDMVVGVASIRKLRNIPGIKQLLSSWRDPDPDADPYRLMDNGLRHFQTIHTAIRELPDRESITDPMELCQRMVEKLGLPEVAVNPLVARSLSSHLPLIDRKML